MKSKEFEKLSPKSKQQYFNLYIAWMFVIFYLMLV